MKTRIIERMRVRGQQVKSMKCSNEISCRANNNDYHFKGIFSIVLNGFVFLVQLPKANDIKKSLVNDVYSVCPSRK